MKKSRYIYIVLVLLIAVAGYLIIRNRTGGSGWSAEDFGVQDTSRIAFISVESGDQTLVLTREGYSWQVNDHFPASSKKVRGLLILLSRMKITGSVQSSVSSAIEEAMNQYGKKVIIADGKKVIRSFVVYHDTVYSDHTFMMHENEITIYRVEVPGVKYRDLEVLFNPDPGFWKSNIIFQYRPEDIRYVHCFFPDKPEQSFRLVSDGISKPVILSYADSILLEGVKDEMAWRYLSYFSNIYVDEYLDDPDINLPGEFPGDAPYVRIRVVDATNHVAEIDSYTAYYYDDDGGVNVNLDEVFLMINGSDWARMKYINLDPLVKQKEYFLTD